jgi:hypothetical protein
MSDNLICGIIISVFTIGIGREIYKNMYPTLDDLKQRKHNREIQAKVNIEMGKQSMEYYDWEEKCLAAGKILDK